jgi:hypothetical protein
MIAICRFTTAKLQVRKHRCPPVHSGSRHRAIWRIAARDIELSVRQSSYAALVAQKKLPPARPGLSSTPAASFWRTPPSRPRMLLRSRARACDLRGAKNPASTSKANLHRRWRGERSKPVRLGVRDHHTRSLCAESPAQTEHWCCWLCPRRIIF